MCARRSLDWQPGALSSQLNIAPGGQRLDIDRARSVDDKRPVIQGPERIGAIPSRPQRGLEAGLNLARANSDPLPAIPRLERIASPHQGTLSVSRPSGDGAYKTPRCREGTSNSGGSRHHFRVDPATIA